MRSFKLANGGIIELNNASVAKSFRERLRNSACTHFSTVLGNGADAYHDSHVHVDLMARSNHYKICQWNVLDPAETAALTAKKAAAAAAHIQAGIREASDVPVPRPVANTDVVTLPRHSRFAISLDSSAMTYVEERTVTVGAWTIAVSYKGDKFEECSMSRSTADLV